MPFGPTGGRANTVLETMNSVNADIAVEMIAIRRRRFILSSFRHDSGWKSRHRVKLCEMGQQQNKSNTERVFSILVMEFSRENCPFSNRDHTWQQFHTFRNGVLDILSSYGSVGPLGRTPILDSYEESYYSSSGGKTSPDFFVVDDDMYGLSVRVEASWTLAKPALLEELAMFLKQCQEWCVYLALIKGGLFVFHDRILYEGSFFAGCRSVEDLYHRCALEADADTAPRKK